MTLWHQTPNNSQAYDADDAAVDAADAADDADVAVAAVAAAANAVVVLQLQLMRMVNLHSPIRRASQIWNQSKHIRPASSEPWELRVFHP